MLPGKWRQFCLGLKVLKEILNKALWKILTVWRQCTPLIKLLLRFLEISDSH